MSKEGSLPSFESTVPKEELAAQHLRQFQRLIYVDNRLFELQQEASIEGEQLRGQYGYAVALVRDVVRNSFLPLVENIYENSPSLGMHAAELLIQSGEYQDGKQEAFMMEVEDSWVKELDDFLTDKQAIDYWNEWVAPVYHQEKLNW